MHNVCMSVLIQIRDVDEAVRSRLKQRAAAQGVSLNALLKELLERESKVPSREQLLQTLRERGDLVGTSAVDLIWAAREERDGQLGLGSDRR